VATVAATAFACAALVSACGGSSSTSSTPSTPATTTVNTAQVAASIKETVLKTHHVHLNVVCPTSVPAEKGRTFECIATGRGTTRPTLFRVTIQSSRGYVTYAEK
jgi:hypothetical protein